MSESNQEILDTTTNAFSNERDETLWVPNPGDQWDPFSENDNGNGNTNPILPQVDSSATVTSQQLMSPIDLTSTRHLYSTHVANYPQQDCFAFAPTHPSQSM